MNFNDIDFSAIKRMVDSLSEEERESLENMAKNMMNPNQEQPIVEEEEELPLFEKIGLDEEDFTSLPGLVQDQIEEAIDLEEYYEEDLNADYSASTLFYIKAFMNLIKKEIGPIYKNVLSFQQPLITLDDFIQPLSTEAIHKLADEQFGESSAWLAFQNLLQFLSLQNKRAEFDTISYADLMMIKQKLFDEKGILLPKTLL